MLTAGSGSTVNVTILPLLEQCIQHLDWERLCGCKWRVVPGKVKEEAKWILDEHGWWYRHSDGSYTKSNWEVIGGQWYYLMQRLYVNRLAVDSGKCYYFASSGAMASNTWIGNDYVDASGAWFRER